MKISCRVCTFGIHDHIYDPWITFHNANQSTLKIKGSWMLYKKQPPQTPESRLIWSGGSSYYSFVWVMRPKPLMSYYGNKFGDLPFAVPYISHKGRRKKGNGGGSVIIAVILWPYCSFGLQRIVNVLSDMHCQRSVECLPSVTCKPKQSFQRGWFHFCRWHILVFESDRCL
jgi:hypothetical protein